MRPAAAIVIFLLAFIAAAHLVRVLLRVEILVDGRAVPLWMSLAAFALTWVLAILLWRENRR